MIHEPLPAGPTGVVSPATCTITPAAVTSG